MAEIKGLLFDLDGVIVDTAKYHFLAWRKMANDLGFDFNEEQNEQLKGISRIESIARIMKWGNVTLTPVEVEKYMKLKNDWYLEHIETLTPKDVLPGADTFIKNSKKLGYKIALGSASKNAKPILDKLELTPLFDALIDGNVVTASKPDPAVFLNGAKALGLLPINCLVFEDAIAGIEAAHNGGMKAVGIGQTDVLENANIVYENLHGISISDILEKISQP
jgi:beta-phosphoglucomutase